MGRNAPSGTETWTPRYSGLDTWSDQAILDAFWEGQARAIASLRPALPSIAAAANALAERLNKGGRLIYCGAGASGFLAAGDAMEIGPTFGWPDERIIVLLAGGAEMRPGMKGDVEDHDDRGRAEAQALHLTPNDAMIAVAASGTTRYTLAALETAKQAGTLTIAIANNPGAPMLGLADQPILLETGAEVITGSTRMNAGTAQKATLGLLSSLTMIRLHRVYDGMMVNMRVQNAKLRDRAAAMLINITGCAKEEAVEALRRAGDRIKPAALILHGIEPKEADRILETTGGDLRAALGQIGRSNQPAIKQGSRA
jgi:N-acetylmuramic acid 6-phosphate etherase